MNRIYRILLLEDLPSDAYFVEREVRKVIKPCNFEWVENKENFLKSLEEFNPDLILSDFSLPGFDWLIAFKLARKHFPLIPFIIVTGSTNPDIIAKCLKAGVTDCISKVNIEKLGPVILNALHCQPPTSPS